jgi:hypothetical protein
VRRPYRLASRRRHACVLWTSLSGFQRTHSGDRAPGNAPYRRVLATIAWIASQAASVRADRTIARASSSSWP